MTVVPGNLTDGARQSVSGTICYIPMKKTVKFVGICDKKRDSDEKDVEFRRNV